MRLPGKGIGWKQFFRELKQEWSADKGSEVAAALTFFGMLALFPFVLFLVSLASVVIQPAQAEQIIDGLSGVAPREVTTLLSERIRQLGEDQSFGLLTLGVLGALWAASGGMVALMRALNTAYGVEEGRNFFRVRLIAIGSTLVTAVLAIGAGVLVIAAPKLASWLGEPFETVIMWARLPVAGLLMMGLWALLYWKLPDVEQRFKFITPGSIVGVLVWVLASFGFSVYVANFGKYDATYGALGGVIVLLLWMWISAQVVVLGAEINAIIEHHSPEGKDPGQKDKAEPRAKRSRARESEQPQTRT